MLKGLHIVAVRTIHAPFSVTGDFLKMRAAAEDFRSGLLKWRVWMTLAGEEIEEQHRTTLLGPIWMLLNYLAFAGIFITIFERGGDEGYIAHVAVGLVVWMYIMETLSGSVSLFRREESIIKGTRLPLSVHIFRLTTQAAMRATYALAGCIILLTLFGIISTVHLWGFVFMLPVVIFMAPPAVTILAFFGAYLRDVEFLVANLLRLGMFLTPVFWTYAGEGGLRAVLYHYNPFTYLLELVRGPVLTGTVSLPLIAACTVATLVLWLLAFITFSTLRSRLALVL